MSPDPGSSGPSAAAACIADICAALRSDARAEERTQQAANAAFTLRMLEARLVQIEASLDRIEAYLGAIGRELDLLIRRRRPS